MNVSADITVVVPTYQRARFLKRALISIQRQTYPHFVVNVWDNNSQDDTKDVVQSFQKQDARFRYCRREQNIGLIGNFAESCKNIQTPYFCMLGDDDFWLSDFLEIAKQCFVEHPGIGCVICNHACLANESFTVRSMVKPGLFPAQQGVEDLLYSGPFLFSMLFKSDLLSQTGGINKNVGYIFDQDFICRSTSKAPYFVHPRITAVLQSWPGSTTQHLLTEDSFVQYENLILLYKSLKEHHTSELLIQTVLNILNSSLWKYFLSIRNKNDLISFLNKTKNLDQNTLNSKYKVLLRIAEKFPKAILEPLRNKYVRRLLAKLGPVHISSPLSDCLDEEFKPEILYFTSLVRFEND